MQGLQGLRAVTGDYKGLQKTCSVTRMSPDTGITRGTMGLQGVTKGDEGLKKVTFGYSRLQEVTC